MGKSLHEKKHLYSPACMTSFGIPENTWKRGEGLEPPCWHDVVLRRKDKIKLAQRDMVAELWLLMKKTKTKDTKKAVPIV